mmetsp:Transcript_11514/g.52202  ORF Transcript_11514/g.52202 Transcript_11514/m.52202 type:complete len:263 (-) Transcript_11514:12-800(-)
MTTDGPSSSARPPPRASSSPWRSSASSARCCRCSPCASAFGSLRCRAIVRGGHARSRRSGSEIVIEGVLSKAARKRRRSHPSRGSGPTAGRRRSSARRSSRARDRTRRRRRGGTGAEAAPGTRPTPATTRCASRWTNSFWPTARRWTVTTCRPSWATASTGACARGRSPAPWTGTRLPSRAFSSCATRATRSCGRCTSTTSTKGRDLRGRRGTRTGPRRRSRRSTGYARSPAPDGTSSRSPASWPRECGAETFVCQRLSCNL